MRRDRERMAKSISDEELQLKVRARRRILGAVALAVALVVLLPMLLDSQPKRELQEIAINIPAQDKAPPFNPSLKPADQGAADVRPRSTGEPANGVARPAPAELTPLEKAPSEKPSPEKPKAVELPRSIEQPRSSDSNKPADTAKANDAKPQDSKTSKFAVQLGVFSNPDNAGQVEGKLRDNKIRHYTETLKSPPGAIRVRAGPYPSRAEAESALAQIKLAGISGGVVVSE